MTLAPLRSMIIRFAASDDSHRCERQFLRAIIQAMAPAISVTAMTTIQVRLRQPGNASAA